MTKIDRRFLIAWLLLISSTAVALIVKHIADPPGYNAGLLDTLEIKTPSHQAALELSQNYQNKLLILVGNETLAKTESASRAIRDQLATMPWVEQIYSNPLNTNKLNQFINYYAQAPFAYLSQKTLDVLARNDQEGLANHYFSLLNQWADPIVGETIELDPSLSLASFLKERLITTGNWEFTGNDLVLRAGSMVYIPLFVSLNSDFLNLQDSTKIYKTLQSIKQQSNESSEVLMTGMILHSASATTQAQIEISSFGLFSLIAVIFVVIFAFRTTMPLFSCLLVIASSLLVGYSALIFIFDSIHLLAFVFAISILGIAVDYGFHILTLRQSSNSTSASVRSKVLAPLTIALATTLVGYSLFLITPITLLHQVVVFVGFGLLGAYLTALFVLPLISVRQKELLIYFSPKRRVGYVLLAFITFIVFMPTLNFDDNVGNLNTRSPEIVFEDKKIAELTGENVYPSLVIVASDDRNELLDITARLVEALRLGADETLVIKSISDWILSIKQQQANHKLVVDNWQVGTFKAVAEYVDETLINKHLKNPKLINISPDFISQDLGLEIIKKDEKVWTAIHLSRQVTTEQLKIINNFPGAEYINIAKTLSLELSLIRHNMVQIIIPAILLIILVLSLYFGLTSGILMVLIPVVSAGLALVGTQFIQQTLNIFNVLACLLIITLSIDYVVFFRAHGVTKHISQTVSLSAITSALTFGVMTFSKTPAVSSFGLTLLIGITLGWALSHVTPLTYRFNFFNGQTK